MEQTRENWVKEVKQAEDRLKDIKEIKVQQSMADEIQTELLNYAKKRLAEYPEEEKKDI